MNTFPISPMVCERLGWVLVHSLWQFALIALLAGVTVRLLRRQSAALRYVFLGVAMIATVVVPISTWCAEPVVGPENPVLHAASDFGHESARMSSVAVADISIGDQPVLDTDETDSGSAIEVAAPSVVPPKIVAEISPAAQSEIDVAWWELAKLLLRPWLAWMVAGWGVGVVLCSLRPLLGWHTLRRLRRVGVSPVSDDVSATLCRVSERLGLRKAVRVLNSTLAQVPVVVGYFKPVILVPVSLVTSIPASQLEAILAHELAHVRRHDFLINLLQTLVETVFFYHPAVWWLSNRLRAEREHCCDDLVVAAFDNRVEYGRALLAIEELRGRRSALALGADDGRLLARVRRIVGLPSDTASGAPWTALSLVVCGIVAICAVSVLSWPSLANSPGNGSRSPFAIELPGGIEVALVGVATGEADSAWWTADGLPLEHPPLAGLPFANGFGDKSRGRSIAVRIRGLNLDDARCVVVDGAKQWARDERGSSEVFETVTTTDALDELEVGTIRVGIGQGEFGPPQPIATTGEKLPTTLSDELRPSYDVIVVQSVEEADGKTRLRLPRLFGRHFVEWSVKDTQGNSHPAKFSIDEGSEIQTFDLPLTRVDRFEYRLRPYRHWVSFENVSLNRGQRTEVKVSTGPIPPPKPDRYLARLPDGVEVEFVGLAPGSEDGTHENAWWKPDGRKLGFAPPYRGGRSVGEDPSSVNSVIRVRGITDTSAVTATAAIATTENEKDESGAVCVAHFGHTDVPEGQTTRSFDVGIAAEPLSPTRLLDLDGKRLPPPADSPIDSVAEDITVEKLGRATWGLRDVNGRSRPVDPAGPGDRTLETNRNVTQVTLQIPLRWRTVDLRIHAIDLAGKSHAVDTTVSLEPNGNDAAYARVAKLFDVPFDYVDHFEYQFRLFRHWVTFKNVSLEPGKEIDVKVTVESLPVSDAEPMETLTAAAKQIEGWGDRANGLRARVVPVLSSMSEDAIDPAQRVDKFAKAEDVAFVVELENVSDNPIKLIDVWRDAKTGEPNPDSNWMSQFVCSVVLFDREGSLIEQPEIEVDDILFALHSAQVAILQPGKTQQFLIKPVRWLVALKPQIQPGSYRVAVCYHWQPAQNATQIKEKHPARSLFEVPAVNVVSAAVAMEVGGESRQADLVWGEAIKGLRAAVSCEPSKATHAHGEVPAVRLHLQNVGTRPLKLISDLWLPDAKATLKNDQGEPVDLDDLDAGGLLSPRLKGLLTLKPQQVAVLDAGRLGLALTQDRANQFDDGMLRKLVAPSGKYSLQLDTSFNNALHRRWVEGQQNVLVKDAWVGELKTGVTPLEITNETIECNIVDAVTGKPVAGTTVNFRFLKPKSGDNAEEIVDDVFWGPQGPSRIYFYVPDKVMQRADREEIEVEWGIGSHSDYEAYSPAERIPLKQFFKEGTKAARETLGTIKLTAKKKPAIAPAKEEAEAAIDPNGEIVGQLVDEIGKPIAGVTVVAGAVINDSGEGGGAKAVTDAEGRYRLKVPSPGIYSVFVRHLDTDPPAIKRMTAIADDGLLVEAGKVTTSRMVWMPGTQVGGALVDDKDQPVSNLTVYCYSMAKPQSTAEVMSVKSDDQGRFEFWLPPGRAYLYSYKSLPESVDKPDGVKLSVHVPLIVPRNGEIPAQAPPLKLVLAEREPKPLGDPEWLTRVTPGTQIVLHADTKVVTGTVVDVDGQPIPGAKVFRYDGPIVDANEQGEFKVTASRGTQFILYAFQPGYQVWSGTPAAGDVLKIVLEKKLAAGDQAHHAKVQIEPVAVTERASIVPLNDIEMQIQRAGTIVALKVAAGAMVKKGDVLIIVNTAETAKREIVAPLDGEVVKVFVRDAEQVKAGQTILRIVQRDRVRVVGQVKWPGLSPREFIGKIEISPNDNDKFEFQGKVTFIDPIADAKGNHRISVEVENRKRDGKWLLVPGQMAKLTILRADDRDLRERDPRDNPPSNDAKAPAAVDEKLGSGHTLRATAVPYSDTVHIFVLENRVVAN